MTKENAKNFLPLVQALAEGKTIQHYGECRHTWEDCDNPHFDDDVNTYRIKPEVEYIPFETLEELIECWNHKIKYSSYDTELEMPLIWVKYKSSNFKYVLTCFENTCVGINSGFVYTFEEMFNDFTFLDGTPIGKIKE